LEEFAFTNVVAVFEEHGRQEQEDDDVVKGCAVLVIIEGVGKECKTDSKHDSQQDGHSSLMNIVALGLAGFSLFCG